MIVGYCPGVFDMFHIGHLNILRRASEQCDILVAGVFADACVAGVKGRSAAIPEDERLAIVSAIRYVDEAYLDFSQDKRIAWEHRHFDVIFKGSDWFGTEKGRLLEARMAEVGVEVVYFPYTETTSSTELRKFLDGA